MDATLKDTNTQIKAEPPVEGDENDLVLKTESDPVSDDQIASGDQDRSEKTNVLPQLETEESTPIKTEPPTHENDQPPEGEETQEGDTEEQATQTVASSWTPVWDPNAQAYYWWNTKTNETTWINPEVDAVHTEDTGVKAEQTLQDTSDIPPQQPQPQQSNPLDFLLDRIDNVVKKKLDGQEDVDPSTLDDITASTNTPSSACDYSQYYYSPSAYDSYYDTSSSSTTDPYTVQAHFDARTGRFKSDMDVHRHNPENLSIENRAKRQMQHFFDVDQYTEQVNAERQMVAEGRISKKRQLTRKEIEHFKKIKKEKKSRKAREWLLQ